MSRVEREATEPLKHTLTQSFKILFWVLPTNSRAWRKPAKASVSLPQLCFYCCGLAFQDTDPQLEVSQTGLLLLWQSCSGLKLPPLGRDGAHLPGIAAGRTPLVSDAITIITLNCIFFLFLLFVLKYPLRLL